MHSKLIRIPVVRTTDQNADNPPPLRKPSVKTCLPRVPQSPAKSRKTGAVHIPLPQQERILTRHVMGQSLRMISREEHRDFKTVAKIILKSSDKMKEYLEEQRAKLFALTSEAVEVIHKGLNNGNYERAYKFLIDTGIMPQQQSASAGAALERAATTEEQTKEWLGKIIRMSIERAQDYGLPSESIEMRPPKNELAVAEKLS